MSQARRSIPGPRDEQVEVAFATQALQHTPSKSFGAAAAFTCPVLEFAMIHPWSTCQRRDSTVPTRMTFCPAWLCWWMFSRRKDGNLLPIPQLQVLLKTEGCSPWISNYFPMVCRDSHTEPLLNRTWWLVPWMLKMACRYTEFSGYKIKFINENHAFPSLTGQKTLWVSSFSPLSGLF